jgi:hypothetical protein
LCGERSQRKKCGVSEKPHAVVQRSDRPFVHVAAWVRGVRLQVAGQTDRWPSPGWSIVDGRKHRVPIAVPVLVGDLFEGLCMANGCPILGHFDAQTLRLILGLRR